MAGAGRLRLRSRPPAPARPPIISAQAPGSGTAAAAASAQVSDGETICSLAPSLNDGGADGAEIDSAAMRSPPPPPPPPPPLVAPLRLEVTDQKPVPVDSKVAPVSPTSTWALVRFSGSSSAWKLVSWLEFTENCPKPEL